MTDRDLLAQYVREYSETVWPDLAVPEPTDADLTVMEIRSDGYADAHVEGGHGTEDYPWCRLTSARECGLRGAAAEFVECN